MKKTVLILCAAVLALAACKQQDVTAEQRVNIIFDTDIGNDDVEEPCYVRYCWGDWIIGNIISCDGFPLPAFNICVNDVKTI